LADGQDVDEPAGKGVFFFVLLCSRAAIAIINYRREAQSSVDSNLNLPSSAGGAASGTANRTRLNLAEIAVGLVCSSRWRQGLELNTFYPESLP
jgi:hypothetical protein